MVYAQGTDESGKGTARWAEGVEGGSCCGPDQQGKEEQGEVYKGKKEKEKGQFYLLNRSA